MSKSNIRDFIDQNLEIFCCPVCRSEVHFSHNEFVCTDCGCSYPINQNIPRFFVPNDWGPSKQDVTERIKEFYEENPFPNYDEFDDVGSLIKKSNKGLFTKLLDEQIPFGTRVIECGCGTGQLTNFLSVANRTVIGTDLCMNSLNMAQQFKEKNNLQRAYFIQMNLFHPCFKDGSFDLVISNGVLHHTADPFLAFETISRLVKPNGYILIGLYHQCGRIFTDIRRKIFQFTKGRLSFLDSRVSDENVRLAKRTAWFMDQYKNPHESKHTIGEVLRWLKRTGLHFVNSIPETSLFKNFSDSERLFAPRNPGNLLERMIVEYGMAFTGSNEGGFFTVIARRPSPELS